VLKKYQPRHTLAYLRFIFAVKLIKMETPSCVKFLKNIVEIEKTDSDLCTALIPFLPENALDKVVAMLQKYPIHLTITPYVNAKDSVRGSFRKGNIYKFCPHIIHIKNNLGKDGFLQTFLHEYAHLLQTQNFYCG
jgi:hypothetical protein